MPHHLEEVMRSVVREFEVQFLHNNEFHPLNIPGRELAAVPLYQHLWERLKGLGTR